MKKIRFMMLCLILALSTMTVQAQLVVTGQVTDVSGNGVSGIPILLSNPMLGMPGNIGVTLTDNSGNYFWMDSSSTSQGLIDIQMMDCDSSFVLQSHSWNPGSTTITANFVYCANPSSCNIAINTTQTPNTNTVSFTTNTVSMSPITYTWDFGDGSTSTQANPTHTYSTVGTYLVTLAASDSTCTAVANSLVVLQGSNNCDAQFTYSGGAINPLFVGFTSQSTGNNLSYYWEFGDSTHSTAANPSHLYAGGGTYFVCLSITDASTGCTDTECQTIVVGNPSPCAVTMQTTSTPNMPNVSFTATATGQAPFIYHWDLGDGTTSTVANPTHTYAQNGLYLACVTVIDAAGCTAIACDSLYIGNAGPIPNSLSGFLVVDSTIFSLPTDAEVFLIEHDSVAGTLTAIDTVLAQQGFFIFDNIPDGQYLVKAALLPSDPNYSTFLPTYHLSELMWSNAAYIDINPNAPQGIAPILLQAGVNMGGPGFIGGLISNGANFRATGGGVIESGGEGTPYEGASMLLLDANDNPVAHTVSAADGSFSFSNLAYGTYKVHVEEMGKISFDQMVTLDANAPSANGIDFDINTSNVTITASYEIKAVEDFKVFPNPATDFINIQVDLKENIDVQMNLTNMTGQIIQQQNLQFKTGENTMSVNVSDLPTGFYFLSFQSNRQVMTYKIFKQ